MRDKLEGNRPRRMTGTTPTWRGSSAAGVMGAVMAVILAMSAVMMVAIALRDRRDDDEEADHGTYVASRMENVVVAGLRPSRHGKHSSRAVVTLIGKGGLRLDARPPMSCPELPIEARIGRIIKVSAETWRMEDGSSRTALSEVDAEQALCGSYTGRDVGRGGGVRKVKDAIPSSNP